MAIHFVPTSVLPYGTAPADERRMIELIEICGRTAYKSEDRITPESARTFVLMLKGLGHLSVLEHSNIVLKLERSTTAASSPASQPALPSSAQEWADLLLKLLGPRNGYHRLAILPSPVPGEEALAVAGSCRAWVETLVRLEREAPSLHLFFLYHLGRFCPSLFPEPSGAAPAVLPWTASLMAEDEQFARLKERPESDLPVFVFKFVCDRGITHEVVRHRVFAYTQESTRYVNYKNRGLTLILPEELTPYYDAATETFRETPDIVRQWVERAETLFAWYQEDLQRGLQPQIARDILPNLLKSEIFASGRWSGWKHFVLLRHSGYAHPRIRLIAAEVRAWFESQGLSFE